MPNISNDTKVCKAIINKRNVYFILSKKRHSKGYCSLIVTGVIEDKEYTYLTYRARSYNEAFVYMLLSLLVRLDYEKMLEDGVSQSDLNKLCGSDKLRLYPFIKRAVNGGLHTVTVDYTMIATKDEVLALYKMLGYEIKQEENHKQITLYLKGV